MNSIIEGALLLGADSGVVIAKQEPFTFDLFEGGCHSDRHFSGGLFGAKVQLFEVDRDGEVSGGKLEVHLTEREQFGLPNLLVFGNSVVA